MRMPNLADPAVREAMANQFAYAGLLPYALMTFLGYEVAPHIVTLARALERVERGDCKRLIVSMPPRHGKSMLVSTAFPAWYLGRRPRAQIITATFSQEKADDWGRAVRNQLASPWFRQVFGHGLALDSRAVRRFNTAQGGVYIATGIGGTITGRGADLLLIDDPHKGEEEARSEKLRAKVQGWFRSDAYTRLMPGGAIVIVQTRWHEADLAGYVQAELAHEGWEVLNLPAINEAGEALWTERFPLDALALIKESVGSRAWEALYQGRPSPAEGGIFKRGWWKRWRAFPQLDEVLTSWDCAFKGTSSSDFVVGQVWGRRGAERYLLDQVRGRMTFTETVAAIRDLAKKWPQARAHLVEDKANGTAVIDTLKREVPGLIAVEPQGGKEARANAVSPQVEAGQVFVPDEARWVGDFIEEAAAFPTGTHDDQVDAMSQALLRWLKPRGLLTQEDLRKRANGG